jgi:hypothetical protein
MWKKLILSSLLLLGSSTALADHYHYGRPYYGYRYHSPYPYYRPYYRPYYWPYRPYYYQPYAPYYGTPYAPYYPGPGVSLRFGW